MENLDEKALVKELSKKYCKSEKYIKLLLKICKEFNVNPDTLFDTPNK